MIIGIDYSYTSPAICILGEDFKSSRFYYATYNKKQAVKARNYEGFLLNEDLKDTERYKEIGNWATNTIAEFIAVNDGIHIGLEGYSFGSSHSLTFNIAENAGILKLYLFNLGIKPTIIPPTTAKKHFSGSGRSNKEDMRQALLNREGIDIVEWLQLKKLGSPAHDIVDSYALALTLRDKNGLS